MLSIGQLIARRSTARPPISSPPRTSRFSWKNARMNSRNAVPAWSGLSWIQRSMRRKFSSAARSSAMSARPAYLRAVSRSGIRAMKAAFSSSPGTLPSASTRPSTSSLRAHLASRLSSRVEIDRRHHRDEIPDARRMQRRVADRHRPALADAEEVHGFDAVRLARAIDAGAEIAVHVVVERMMRCRSAPG